MYDRFNRWESELSRQVSRSVLGVKSPGNAQDIPGGRSVDFDTSLKGLEQILAPKMQTGRGARINGNSSIRKLAAAGLRLLLRSGCLEDFFGPVFQHRLHLGSELIRQRAVDQAMIEGQRQEAGAADGDGVVHHHRLLHHAAHT